MLSGPKCKLLNKETVTFVLLESLNLPSETIGEIVELVWLSDDLLEELQQAFARRMPPNTWLQRTGETAPGESVSQPTPGG